MGQFAREFLMKWIEIFLGCEIALIQEILRLRLLHNLSEK